MVEFAYILPILVMMSMTGAELVNYITVKMRLSQVALHIADNASRLGTGSVLTARQLSETEINDVLTGAGLQAGGLDLYRRGRVILSDLEPMAIPNTNNRYRIVWQRCRGAKEAHLSSYGVAGQTELPGIGPAGRMVGALDFNATMFVEVFYEYQPLILTEYAPSTTITEIASMTVRERRDLSQVFNEEDVDVSSCGG